MIPSVFVSSSSADLHHVAGAVFNTIVDLRYQPVTSKSDDADQTPSDESDPDSIAVKKCQIAVLIIGKCYQAAGIDEPSDLHNVFRAARDAGIAIIALVDATVTKSKDVLSAF